MVRTLDECKRFIPGHRPAQLAASSGLRVQPVKPQPPSLQRAAARAVPQWFVSATQ